MHDGCARRWICFILRASALRLAYVSRCNLKFTSRLAVSQAALLLTAVLFGGSILYSFGFAAFVFTNLPAETGGPLIRKAFPHFYLFVLATSAIAATLCATSDVVSGVILATIAVTTLVARQILMPAVNAATDQGAARHFKVLHSLSVLITLAHIVGAAVVILRLAALV